METIHHAGRGLRVLDDRDGSIAVIVAGYCAMEHPKRDDAPARQLYAVIAVFRFPTVAVMHLAPFLGMEVAAEILVGMRHRVNR